MSLQKDDVEWTIQKMCVDIDEYELIVEKEKSHWNCQQKRESWKWLVSYHGSIVASGSQNSVETAKEFALANMPVGQKSS
tara:strand:- start:266 stop:505 length:240 start_codon:yes stop_codon:yes gene_type:complete